MHGKLHLQSEGGGGGGENGGPSIFFFSGTWGALKGQKEGVGGGVFFDKSM